MSLPENGLWSVTSPDGADAVPFDLIRLDMRRRKAGTPKGAVRARNLETRLSRIQVTAPHRFAAVYDIRGHRGVVEGTLRADGSLRLDVSGTLTGTFVGRAAVAAGTDSTGGEAATRVVQALAADARHRAPGRALTAA